MTDTAAGLPVRPAYVVLAHWNPELVDRLLSRLEPDAPVFLHFDKRAPAATFRRLSELVARRANVHLVANRRVCRWGEFGIVAGTLEAIHELVTSRLAYDYAILLSGQDYPLLPADRRRAILEAHRGDEFIECFDFAAPNRWSDHGGDFQPMRRVMRWHFAIRSHHFSLPIPRRFPTGLRPHGGSQWWALTAPCLEWIDAFVRERPDVIQYFRHVNVPDESFFQTLIAASPFAARIRSDDLKFAIWDRPEGPRPAVLFASDTEAMRRSGKPFARKFRDLETLEAIDRELLGLPGVTSLTQRSA